MPNVIFEDHYAVLGVDKNVAPDELKTRYYKLARQTHPDCLGSDASEEAKEEAVQLFSDIATAYEQLSNPVLRNQIDEWLACRVLINTVLSPTSVPPPGQYLLNGIWCWVEFRTSWGTLVATVTVQLNDLFRTTELGQLPHGAWLDKVIAVDEKGDQLGCSYSMRNLRHDVRRLQAEAKRNELRRAWRKKLTELERQLRSLADQHVPADRAWSLLGKARTCVESGVHSLRGAEHPDTVTQALRELEKELDRVTGCDSLELLLDNLMGGVTFHDDLAYNERLLRKLQVYAFRSGGEYVAPTPEDVRNHYRRRLEGLDNYSYIRSTNLRLPDDIPTILELAAEGAIDLAPDTITVQGNKGPSEYEVMYGFAKVGDQVVPAGIIVVPDSVYQKSGAQYGKASQFPTLPHGITLLIRVKVRVQSEEMLSAPIPDGKSLQNEVARCRAQLRNPRSLEEQLSTFDYFTAWPHPFGH